MASRRGDGDRRGSAAGQVQRDRIARRVGSDRGADRVGDGRQQGRSRRSGIRRQRGRPDPDTVGGGHGESIGRAVAQARHRDRAGRAGLGRSARIGRHGIGRDRRAARAGRRGEGDRRLRVPGRRGADHRRAGEDGGHGQRIGCRSGDAVGVGGGDGEGGIAAGGRCAADGAGRGVEAQAGRKRSGCDGIGIGRGAARGRDRLAIGRANGCRRQRAGGGREGDSWRNVAIAIGQRARASRRGDDDVAGTGSSGWRDGGDLRGRGDGDAGCGLPANGHGSRAGEIRAGNGHGRRAGGRAGGGRNAGNRWRRSRGGRSTARAEGECIQVRRALGSVLADIRHNIDKIYRGTCRERTGDILVSINIGYVDQFVIVSAGLYRESRRGPAERRPGGRKCPRDLLTRTQCRIFIGNVVGRDLSVKWHAEV